MSRPKKKPEDIKKVGSVICNERYVIAYGIGIYVFDRKGNFICQVTGIRNVCKIGFLAEDRIVADCGALREYLVISLENGEILSRVKQPKKDYSLSRFFVSQDRRYVYDACAISLKIHVIRLDLANQEILCFRLQNGLYAVGDYILDEEGILCFLESGIFSMEPVDGQKKNLSITGVRCECFDSALGYGTYKYWKGVWMFELPRQAACFYDSPYRVLTNDWHVYDIRDGSLQNLLQNSSWNPQTKAGLHTRWDETRRYLLSNDDQALIVIDTVEKKAVAQYGSYHGSGCIVDDQLWLCTDEQLVRKPFPLIEERRKKKNIPIF